MSITRIGIAVLLFVMSFLGSGVTNQGKFSFSLNSAAAGSKAYIDTRTDFDIALQLIRDTPSYKYEQVARDLKKAIELVAGPTRYEEVIEALIARLPQALDDDNYRFAKMIFLSLGEYGHKKYFEKVYSLYLAFYERHSHVLVGGEIDALAGAMQSLLTAAMPLVRYETHQHFEKQADLDNLAATLAKFKANLQAELKGQPEIVDLLVQVRRKDLVYNQREEAESVWLMGLPGTGKDTAARAYVNAIWNDENAWKKHMFTVSPIRDEQDLNTVLGSSVGYIGSTNFPEILDFLVAHSCGRYEKVNLGKPEQPLYKIVEKKDWRETANSGDCPQNAVLYLDEFHNWSREGKDTFAKKALEDGTFVIRNPNGGLAKIYVPVTIIFGSNDGIELLTARERNGQRYGKPMNHAQMMAKYTAIGNDKSILKNSILSGNGDVNSRIGRNSPGTSEEFLNRVHHIAMMRPLVPDTLQEIAQKKLEASIQKLKRGFPDVQMKYAPGLIQFLQEYDYVAEDNARPIGEKVSNLIEAPFFEAIGAGYVGKNTKNVTFDIAENADATFSLVLNIDGKKRLVPIAATESRKLRQPISDEELRELSLLEEKLNARVIGQPSAMKQIARSIFNSEEGRKGIKTVADAKEPARTSMLLGWTSTGKTETSKALAEVLLGSRDAVKVIAFTPGTNEHDLKAQILGVRDQLGGCIASDFMKFYDRNNGRAIFVFDEIANVRDKSILNMLYDILREPVVSTFCDGKERIMSNVMILITGNAGQEILEDLPRNLPDVVRRAALKEAHKMLVSNPNVRREVYERYFSPAFLARVGDEHISNFSPLEYLAAAELFQLKMKLALQDLKAKEGRRGWDVRFKDESVYRKTIDIFEREGFNVREQGASIDRFVSEQFKAQLRELLLKNLVTSGSTVVIDMVDTQSQKHDENDFGHQDREIMTLRVQTEKGPLVLDIDGHQKVRELATMKEELVITAFHEAGHALVTKVYLHGFREPEFIKILPGVTRIADKWVYYAGLADAHQQMRAHQDIASVLREIAVLMGGTVGEDMIVDGGTASMGKSNDIERATKLAENAILTYGLEPKWGDRVSDKSQLSQKDLVLLEKLVKQLLEEGRVLAEEAIKANPQTFMRMGNDLARKGLLNRTDLQKIFAETSVKLEADADIVEAAQKNGADFERAKPTAERRRGMKLKFNQKIGVLPLSEVVDLKVNLEKQRAEEIAKLKIDPAIPFGGASDAPTPTSPQPSGNDCASLLGGKAAKPQ